MFKRLHSVILLISSIFVIGVTHADEIHMKNGDRISGEIIKMEETTLELKTKYAGTINIQWNDVEAIKTDTATKIVLDDKTRIEAHITPLKDNTVALQQKSDAKPILLELSRITHINPSPLVVINTVTDGAIKYSGRVNFGLNYTKGNTDTEKLHLDAEVIARTLKNRYTVGAELNREKDGDIKITSNSTLYLKYDHFINGKWYLYTNGTFKEDKFKDLELRSSIGAGAGHQFYESDPLNLLLEAGLNYVDEDFIAANDDDYMALRWAIKYDQKFFKKWIKAFHEHEGLQGIEDKEDLIISSKTGLRFFFIKNVEATGQLNADWENSPAPGTKRTDLTYLLTFGYHW